MQFAFISYSVRCILKAQYLIWAGVLFVAGCNSHTSLPSAVQLAEFENAGPLDLSVDMDRLVRARIGGGPYRLVTGDVLELTMPSILQVVTAGEPGLSGSMASYVCRISEGGTITLPVVGELNVAGKTLAETESAVSDAYYPEYTAVRASVFVRVTEYKTAKVSVTGAVNKPGIYSLHSDQMSLVALLMEAGGIVDGGAASIRIIHSDNVAPNDASPAHQTGKGGAVKEAETIHEVARRIAKRPSRQSARLKDAKWADPLKPRSYPDRIEVQLAFRQPASSGTIGGLTARYCERVLLAAQIDIASEIEREAFLERLALREPRVSTSELNQRLCALAELLRPGTGRYPDEYATVRSNTECGASIAAHKTEWPVSLEKLAVVTPYVPAAETIQRPHGLAMSYDRGQSARITGYGVASQSLASSVKLGMSGSGQDFAVAEALDNELLEIPVLETSPKTGRQGKSGKPQEREPLVLPVRGLNIPFADVALRDGDSVIVERLQMPLFTVIGLVNSPGNFPYPPDARYNLMRAVGFAGGVDVTAEPHYATIYRLKPDGTIASMTVRFVEGSKLTEASNTLIKPGDIIDVMHTPRTRTNVFLEKISNFHVGAYFPIFD